MTFPGSSEFFFSTLYCESNIEAINNIVMLIINFRSNSILNINQI